MVVAAEVDHLEYGERNDDDTIVMAGQADEIADRRHSDGGTRPHGLRPHETVAMAFGASVAVDHRRSQGEDHDERQDGVASELQRQTPPGHSPCVPRFPLRARTQTIVSNAEPFRGCKDEMRSNMIARHRQEKATERSSFCKNRTLPLGRATARQAARAESSALYPRLKMAARRGKQHALPQRRGGAARSTSTGAPLWRRLCLVRPGPGRATAGRFCLGDELVRNAPS